MQVAIFGAKGFLGNLLAKSLGEHGIRVLAYSSSDGSGIDPQSGLLPHTFAIPKLTDVVVYLAQSPHYRGTPGTAAHLMAVNVHSAIKAALLARSAGARRFLYASTGTVYAPSLAALRETAPVRRDNWYALSKVQAEEALALLRGDMEVIIVRPFGIYGPGQSGKLVPNLARSIREGMSVEIQGSPLDSKDVDGLKISLCYVDDAVEICRSLIMDGGPPYLNLAGENAVSIREIATNLGQMLHRDVAFHMSERPRDANLIADVTLLRHHCHPRFRSLESGLKTVVAHMRAKSDAP